MTSLVSTAVPADTLTEATVPALGANISFSIFIASRIATKSPSFTLCPIETLTSTILPGIGATILVALAGTTVALGATILGVTAATGVAATGVTGVATGVKLPPNSSTSTSYVLPFTVTASLN